MTGTRRRSYEEGHRPKYLIVIDDSEECDRALYFAARRCARISAALVMLTVTEVEGFDQWLGVGNVMKQEAQAAAESVLETAAARCRTISGIEAEKVILNGAKADAIKSLINEDRDIIFLVLAAANKSDGPGPLVSMLAGKAAGTFPVPVVIVPGDMSDEEIDALA
jgi:nucleotide-binding universal stress UspA family protein